MCMPKTAVDKLGRKYNEPYYYYLSSLILFVNFVGLLCCRPGLHFFFGSFFVVFCGPLFSIVVVSWLWLYQYKRITNRSSITG